MVLALLPVGAMAAQAQMRLALTPTSPEARIGDTVDFVVTAEGTEITAIQFELLIPAGLTYVAGSASVPSGLKEELDWASTDWTEVSMMWTGYNDLPTDLEEGTVLLTFSCVVEAAGTHCVELYDPMAFDSNYEYFPPDYALLGVTVPEDEPVPTVMPDEPVPTVMPDESFMQLTVVPSANRVQVGDTVDFTVYAYGNGITALQFNLLLPEGLGYVAGSARIPAGLKDYLGWAAVDWTENTMMWTGYNDLPADFEDGTVILTFSCVAVTSGYHSVSLHNLIPFDPNYQEMVGEQFALSVYVPGAPVYFVAGVPELCGSEWEPADPANQMFDHDGDGIYTITYPAVAPGSYEFKVTNGTWENSWGSDWGNYIFTMVTEADVTICFDTADCSIEVCSEGLEPEEPVEPVEREYSLVGYINGGEYGCEDDYLNPGQYIFKDGILVATFTEDSYVFIKTTDNLHWYLTEGYTTDSVCTFVENGWEKMFVPGNVELTFVLTENPDGSVTLSYSSGGLLPPEPESPFMNVTVEASVTEVQVGDTVDYTVYAHGDGLTALQFQLIVPEGMSYVAGSAAVPDGLKDHLGWAATDFTESYMMWTGYNDLPATFEEGTVLLTFSCIAEAAGAYEVELYDLIPFDPDYNEFEAGLTVDQVTVSEGYDALEQMQQIVDEAYALPEGACLPYTATLTGTVISIDTPYSSTYQNITVTMAVEGREDKPIGCYRLKGEGADTLAVGDIITVTGTLTNYYGTIEFAQGCMLEDVPKPDGCQHLFGDQPVIVLEPTCTQAGYSARECVYCGELSFAGTLTENLPRCLGPNYTNNMYRVFPTVTVPGATQLVLHFDPESWLEDSYDLLHIYAGDTVADQNYVTTCTGGFGSETVTVNADSFTVVLETDMSNTDYGFAITAVDYDFCSEGNIPATGHQYGSYRYNNDATCSQNGTETAVCVVCGSTDTRECPNSTIPHTYSSQIIAPTCTEQGYTLHSCSVCDNTYKDDFVDPIAHSFHSGKCTACGAYSPSFAEFKVVPNKLDCNTVEYRIYAHGENITALQFNLYLPAEISYVPGSAFIPEGLKIHLDWAEVDWTEESMMWTGYNDLPSHFEEDTLILTFTCKITAPGSYQVVPSALLVFNPQFEDFDYDLTSEWVDIEPHSFTDYVSNGDATCLTDGTKTAKCPLCDTTDTLTDEGSALGHSFTDYASNGDATCTLDGTKTAKCERCDATDTLADEGSALGHSFTDYTSNGDADCLNDGTKTAKCDRCQITHTAIDKGSALGHSFADYTANGDADCLNDGTKTAHCGRCEATHTVIDQGSAGHRYENGSCSLCGKADTAAAVLTGTLSTWNEGEALLTLSLNGETVATLQAANGRYTVSALAVGEYVLTVSKDGCASRQYTVSVSAGQNILDLTLNKTGDINGDTKLNMGDIARIYSHVKKTTMLEDEYQRGCADLTGDGKLNMGDTARAYAQVKKV